ETPDHLRNLSWATGEDGYPLYRRRTPEEGGFTARKKGLQLDNRWVVPHSPLLCKLFMSHINVEFCNSVKAIKYICKYINKGSDRAVFEVRREGATTDEVTQFQTGRYLSTNEATWRLFQFPIHARHPPVQHLSVHLENGQRVYFNQHTLTDRAADPQRTTLTAFFQLCNVDHFASHLLYCNVPQYYTWNNSKRLWVRRKQGCPVPGEDAIRAGDTLGRVYTVHPMNMECFCLRLLLHVVEGPTSFQALRTVEGEVCASFKEACSKRGLLEDDQHWDLTLEDAVVSRSPVMLRQLFAIMLVYCSLTNASQLWEKYRDSMTEDILLQARRQADDEYPQFTPTMYNQALIFLEDKVLEIGGCSLDNYALTTPDRIQQRLISRHMLRETSYANDLLQQYVDDNEPLLTPDQTDAYTKIMLKVNSGSAGILFLDAPGGTGKTFLLNLLLAKVRQNNQIALAVASSGIAATLLSGGRTAHSAFKLPLNLCHQENPVCSIRKGTDEANVLKETRLIVWDEATMAHKNALYALDKSLKDIRSNDSLFGGVVLLLAGDFRQTLPIIPRGTPADEINACLKSSHLWRFVESMQLTTNMRSRLLGATTADTFPSTLLQIGNGQLPQDQDGHISMAGIGNFVATPQQLCHTVYPNLNENHANHEWLCERAILAPTNETVGSINSNLLKQIPGEERSYRSVDSVTETDQVTHYPTEFLNSLDPSGLPPHILTLKHGCPIILLRNLDAPRLCNGTRLIVKQMMAYIIEATIITGQGKGQSVFIPRIPLIPSDCPFPFKRLQFPVRPCFAMTINKAQGQSLRVVGLDLHTPCFSHGQLYVGCSRVGESTSLHIHALDQKTKNVVYPSVLQ
ncbi:ATP-dependent DNA helicase, partial [Caligus rogercresseyi]